ncbi:CcdC protein domain-containing protein [Paenibacillus sp. GCM10023248]|uniref:CcdC protein domain-containing protein n=1 Tax=Bacillales TaxID=1385 RepID=UPI0023794874|nr:MULTISPECIES: CcdC protein domain-containing protein [Bacillales]MDD9270919.1 DUF1453 family protein [Paenibacillus sp. MAHUQ-63]MDR6882946.1 membrane protein CcdC involved in cytochrome C biogenesis [Bacillus sp. 3255]
MNIETLVGYGVAALVIILVIWLKTRGRKRPIKNKGIGILLPVILLPVLFGFSIYSLTQIPDHPFHLPVLWEMLCAIVLGIGLGSIMLYHTGYEKLEDGYVYAKPNKNFKYVLIAIVALRIVLSQYFKGLDYTEFTVLTMLMAYLYICVWRVGSFIKFRRASAGL